MTVLPVWHLDAAEDARRRRLRAAPPPPDVRGPADVGSIDRAESGPPPRYIFVAHDAVTGGAVVVCGDVVERVDRLALLLAATPLTPRAALSLLTLAEAHEDFVAWLPVVDTPDDLTPPRGIVRSFYGALTVG